MRIVPVVFVCRIAPKTSNQGPATTCGPTTNDAKHGVRPSLLPFAAVAYDERLADRIRVLFDDHPGVSERKMFGGLAFMVDAKMAVGVIGEDLVVRVGPDGFGTALAEPHTRPMDFTGRPMTGFVYVGPKGVNTAARLQSWVERGMAFAASLPDKKPGKSRLRTKRGAAKRRT